MGKYNPEIHHRHSIRLKDYDYSHEGAYFVTICTKGRSMFFGEIKNNEMFLNTCGEIAQVTWNSIPRRFPGVELDHFVVMPNHVHGILVRTQRVALEDNDVIGESSTDGKNRLKMYRNSSYRYQTLSETIRTFKAVISYEARRKGNTPDFEWQREYYDHIIRNPEELAIIRAYIVNNPSKWQDDKLHPLSHWQKKLSTKEPNNQLHT